MDTASEGADLSLHVIRVRDLRPGDIILVKAERDDIKAANDWAGHFFKRYNVSVGVILKSMEIEILQKEGEQQ